MEPEEGPVVCRKRSRRKNKLESLCFNPLNRVESRMTQKNNSVHIYYNAMACVGLNPTEVCRLCLSNNETLIDIFDESRTISSVSLLQRIHVCLPVKIILGENRPTVICKPCSDLVDRFHEFWVATKSNQLKIDRLLCHPEDTHTSRDEDILVVQGPSSEAASETGLFKDHTQVPSDSLNNHSHPPKRQSPKNQVSTKANICIDCGVHKSGTNFELAHSSRIPCDICSQVEALGQPELKERRLYECSICDYKNSSLSNFKIHMMKHDGKHLATCQYCGRGFYSKSACEEHQLTKHSNLISMNHCSECNVSYHSKAYLRLHMKTHSLNRKTDHFQCEICGKTYSSWKGIKRHKMIHHQGQVYQCEICDKEVKSLESLNNHRKIHRGEKSFVCATCGKFFRTRNGLTVHERTHTGSKPFKCHICEQAFSQSSSLKVHLRYHNGERPYQCTNCNKKYVTATLLKIHQKSHKQEDDEQMSDTNELDLLKIYE